MKSRTPSFITEIPLKTTSSDESTILTRYEAVRKPLSQRWHECCNIKMQRDLYSALLSKRIDEETNTLDLAMARTLWQGLEPVLNETISRINQTASGRIFPASFGFNRIRSQSSSYVNPISNATKNPDVVIRISEDESQIEVA
jgi:putative transposase